MESLKKSLRTVKQSETKKCGGTSQWASPRTPPRRAGPGEGMGMGVVAKRRLREGDLLATIPKSARRAQRSLVPCGSAGRSVPRSWLSQDLGRSEKKVHDRPRVFGLHASGIRTMLRPRQQEQNVILTCEKSRSVCSSSSSMGAGRARPGEQVLRALAREQRGRGALREPWRGGGGGERRRRGGVTVLARARVPRAYRMTAGPEDWDCSHIRFFFFGDSGSAPATWAEVGIPWA